MLKISSSPVMGGMIVMFFQVFVTEGSEATNQMDVAFAASVTFSIEDNRPSITIIRRYEQELLGNRDAVTDRLGSPSFMKWARKSNHGDRRAFDSFNDAGLDAIATLLGDSASETAAALLPLEHWEDVGFSLAENAGEFFQSIFTDIFTGIFGNTVETRSDLLADTVTASGYSWQETIRGDDRVRYGIRPWRTDPYVYIGARIGSWGGLDDLPIAIFEQRIGARIWEGGKLQTSLTFPISQQVKITGAYSFDPLHLYNADQDRQVISARLERTIGSNRSLKALYVGFRSTRENDVSLTFGFFTPL